MTVTTTCPRSFASHTISRGVRAGRRPGHRLLAALALCCLVAPARAGVESFVVNNPRDFGYTVGDVFEIQVELTLSGPSKLDVASLPEAGRVTRWLELAEPELESGGGFGETVHTLRLRYQVMNAARAVSGAGTPPVALVIDNDGDRVPVLVSSFGFTVMPVVSDEAAVEGAPYKLQPPTPPPPVPTAGRWWLAGALAALIALLAGYLAYLHFALPWLGRNNGPFARALRDLGRTRADGADAALAVHGAFNATAGRAVFAGELERFFGEHPRYEALREDIAGFYADSQRAFFGAHWESGPEIEDMRRLCRGLRDLERRAL